MQTVTKQYRTETGHRLVDYDGKCAHLHGHSYLWEVTASAPSLTHNGMIVDFSDLKAAMVAVLEQLDHCLVLHNADPVVGAIRHIPASNGAVPRVRLFPFNPTAENFAAWAAQGIQRALNAQAPDNEVFVTRVRVWETVTSFADWHLDGGGFGVRQE